ncbi:Crp/Fnr family transcriptional regulator [Campylobacter upsaliensis]|uniref:Crp family transcriptional regulator n=1 Tax=Campylobacter upsaliensis JV21 TaxID=888826 RepID=A0A828QY06_CAMUP|nr:Crp/Fnr family transcriptional regulator [Campylobacter upsaliensis]EFU72563.1 Crp family transcriptional regulator [Campylobacter upsaliensis JV21]EHJ4416373.1 Crp/Fnr family transcriptional regulator [Campylobacter upsaliensis]EHK6249325.1 Crp/Fnr family transcriptional regulator [Campylobacter upsaliensis]EHP6619881.1 Crp/Fnr family transcriptional regulator [Campylobacter upsaliensis]EIC5479418.1 Crp/Fnr family transcriptional regulator [Campylobacter upsaliensis]
MQPLTKDTLIQINATMCGDERSLEVLQNQGIVKAYVKGYRIYPDSNELLGFLYVLSGKIRFFSVSSNAKEITIFTISGKESCIITTSCIFSNIQADVVLEFMEDSSVFILPNKSFEALTHSNESIMRFNLSLVSKRLKQAFDTINDVTFKSLKNRVVKFLLSNARDNHVKASQESIANNIGSAREAVARVIKELKAEGLIDTNRNEIVLKSGLYELGEEES